MVDAALALLFASDGQRAHLRRKRRLRIDFTDRHPAPPKGACDPEALPQAEGSAGAGEAGAAV